MPGCAWVAQPPRRSRLAAALMLGATERDPWRVGHLKTMSSPLPDHARYRCARCGKDWTTDLENISERPSDSIDWLCDCGERIVAQGTGRGVQVLTGLVAAEH
jgi:DNA-directed RNA polymerase subunit RPC12/RpoP